MNAPAFFPQATSAPRATVMHGDAASTLAMLPSSFVDMAYIDPPFGNRQIWSGRAGRFDDRWIVTPESDAGWAALRRHNHPGADLCALFARTTHHEGYFGFVAGLLLAVRRALKPTGSLWLHFDDVMGAHIRIIAEAVFGVSSCLGTIVWKRTGAHSSQSKRFGRVHDTIAVYARTRAARWRLHRCAHSDLVSGDPAQSALRVEGFREDHLNATFWERVGYPTQKPISLISSFVSAATLDDDLVLDPTCGSGTTLVAASRLGRRAIGIDASASAVACANDRLSHEALS